MADQDRYDFFVAFTMSLCALESKQTLNKFAISTHIALKLGIQALGSYLKQKCEYELDIIPNTKVGAAKDHGENYMKVKPHLVRHLLRNRLLSLRTITIGWLISVELFSKYVHGTIWWGQASDII